MCVASFAGDSASGTWSLVPAGQQQQPQLQQRQLRKPKDAGFRSSLAIYRDEIVSRDRELARRPKIATTEYWDSVKAGWENLPPERKRAYEDQSASEQAIVKAQRTRLRLAAQESRLAGAVAIGGGSGAASSSSQEQPQPQQQEATQRIGSSVYINQTLETAEAHAQLAEPVMPSLQSSSSMEISWYPLPVKLFGDYLKRQRGHIVSRCEDFKQKCQKMQGGTGFPNKVRYHTHCGAVCPQSVAEGTVKFHRKIKASMSTYVEKNFKTAADVASSDVLFAIEVHGKSFEDGSDTMAVTFASMTCAAGRRAQFPSEQTFVPCCVVDGNLLEGNFEAPYEDNLLEYGTDIVETKAKPPASRVRDDRVVRQYDADEMAAILMKGHINVTRLVWRRLAWTHPYDSEGGGIHRLRVIGAHASEPMQVEKGTDSVAPDGDGEEDGGGGNGEGSDDIDFLNLHSAPAPRPAPAPRAASAARPDKAARQARPRGAAADVTADLVAAEVLGDDYSFLVEEATCKTKDHYTATSKIRR